jgi:5'-methylthioadenosine phosphorylase
MAQKQALFGVIGGSGLYEIPGLTDRSTATVETPWGAPSDEIVLGTLQGTRTAFLPRHGRGHRFTPSEVNYRANVAALKMLGCEFVLSVSATGSMKEEIAPGHLVVPDQFIDRTVARARTFFGDGVVGHISFADPVCPTLRALVLDAARRTQVPTHDGGVYVCIEGPQFSTRAESLLYRSWGVSVVGMTNMPEARLAREAGMSYATLALPTDYDCWHTSEDAVSVDAVVATLRHTVAVAREVVSNVAQRLAAADAPRQSPFADVVASAVMTDPDRRPPETLARLRSIVGDVLG